MCRHIVFSGTCPHCTEHFVWEDLSQELSCLEAKNTGVFGQCAFGVQIEEHEFDQECEPCAAENERDEGYGAAEGIDNELVVPPLGPGGEFIIPDPTMKQLLAGQKHADAGGQQEQQEEDGGGGSGKSKTKKQRVV